MLPWHPRDVVRLIRDVVARSDDCETLLTARLVSKDWKLAVTVLANPVVWCPHLTPLLEWRRTVFSWPSMVEKGRYQFDLPPFLLELLLLNKNHCFRHLLTWMEVVELAQRMVHKKDPVIEKLEREAWFKICGNVNGHEEVEQYVVDSIFLWDSGTVDWFCAGVQTLLFTPAFRRPTLALLKGVQRHWFPRELYCDEIGLEFLKMGVWCTCENSVPAPRGFIVKRRRAGEEDELWFNRPNVALNRWTAFPMHKAWRHFIGLRLFQDERVLQNIARAQDPELVERIDRLNSSWQF